MKRVLRILFDIGLYAVIVIGLVWGLPRGLSKLLKTPYPMATITSGSMWPILGEGDLVFIKGVEKSELKVGDIVVWRNPQGFTIHRISRMNEKELVTKGDANFNEDAPVNYDSIVGRTLTLKNKPVRIPYIGFITIAASKRIAQ